MQRLWGLQQFGGLSIHAVLAIAAMFFANGCMRASRAPITPPHWQAAPGADPFLNPPSTGQPTLAPPDVDPGDNPQPTFGDDYTAPLPVETGRVPTPVELPPLENYFEDSNLNSNIQPPRLEAPTIVPQAVTVPPTLGLTVRGPEKNLVGEVSVFEITLQNSGDNVAEDVVVECRFEAGFVFPGSTDQQVNQTVGTLAAGASRDVKLSLQSDRAGYHCVEFTVVAKGAKPTTKKVCVEYRDPALSLEVNGPAKRMVGGHAEWNLSLNARDFLPVTNAVVVVDYDSTYLKPIGGSEGAKQELGKITWPLGILDISERVELQVEFECLMPVDSTCLSYKVLAGENEEQTVESCLAIERRLGALEIDLVDSPDPVKVGGEMEYKITVANRDLASVHDVQLTATLPTLFRAVSFEVREGGQEISGVNAAVDGSLVKFDSVDVLAPDSVLTYRIKVKALNEGTGRLLLSVSSDDARSGKIRLEEVSTSVR